MGVTGLWKLIDAAGKEVTLESLEGKVFAVDASILMNQAVKGMKDQPNAHLYVLFLRLCKLLTFKIKPIFVFDGAAPVLKKQTLIARQRRREESYARANDAANRLKRKSVQAMVVNRALGKPVKVKKVSATSLGSGCDIFELPPLPESSQMDDDAVADDYFELPIHQVLYSGDLDLSEVDINSDGFKSLPLEYQHEILEELKEHNKHNHEKLTPTVTNSSNDFSKFQLKKLLKCSKLSNKIETLRKGMIEQMVDHADSETGEVIQANRILSEDTTHFLLTKRVLVNKETPPTTTATVTENPPPAIKKPRTVTENKKLVSNTETPASLSMTAASLTEPMKFSGEASSDALSDVISIDDISKAAKISKPEVTVQPVATNVEKHNEVGVLENSTSNPGPSVPMTSIELARPNGGKCEDKVSLSKSVSDLTQTRNPVTVELEISGVLTTARSKEQPLFKQQSSSSSESTLTIDPDTLFFKTKDTKPRANELSTLTDKHSHVGNSPVTTKVIDEDKFSSEAGLTVVVPREANSHEGLFPHDIFISNALQEETPNQSSNIDDGLMEAISSRDSDKLTQISNEIQYSTMQLETELRKQESVSQAVTQSMIDDAIELLQLFGIPYVLSPSEAEAQCAKLELLKLSNGTITDDSDIWLFGGRYVLKNFFQQGKYVLSYHQSDIQKLFGLDREKMISLALVCGSDYTDGIPGAGAITAMEILSEFATESGVAALGQFKHWAESVKLNSGLVPANNNSKIKAKLKKFVDFLPDAFPNRVVVDAYLQPNVDESNELFEWSLPDLDLLRDFAHRKLSWPSQKVDDLVCPVLKRLNATDTQSKLGKYFNLSGSSSINPSAEFHSKRLKSAISKLVASKPVPSTSSVSQPKKKAAAAPTKPKRAQRKTKLQQASNSRGVQRSTTRAGPPAACANGTDKLKHIRDEINLSEESD